MKKTTCFLLLWLLLFSQNLSAEEVGSGAVAASEESSSNNWKNWVFASTALISAAIGVVVVSLNPGSTSH